jgi:uncharacterized protein
VKLTVFQDADPFLQKAHSYLHRQEAANTMLLNICSEYQQNPARFKQPPFLALVEDETGILLAAGMAPPRKIFLFTDRDPAGPAASLLARDLFEGGLRPPSVFAGSKISFAFARAWHETSGADYKEGLVSRLYDLHQVTPPGESRGRLRQAVEKDTELVTRWVTAFQQEAIGANPVDDVRPEVIRRIEKNEVFIWEDGQPVAMAARTRPSAHGIAIRWVYTPPELRRRGYAAACVAALSQHCLDTGKKFCCLFTDLANPTTNHIYQQIGYWPLGDFIEYSFCYD